MATNAVEVPRPVGVEGGELVEEGMVYPPGNDHISHTTYFCTLEDDDFSEKKPQVGYVS